MTPRDAVRARVSSERGIALPLALLVLLLVSVVGFALIGVGMTEVTVATNWRSYNAAFYAADAGLQKGLVDLRDLFTQTPTPSTSQLNAITAPTLSNPKLQFAAFSVTAGAAPYRTTFTSGPYKGLYGFVSDYQITSKVCVTSSCVPGETQANLTQTVRYQQIPLFQFGIFYGKGVDLQINPGPAMTITGRVHSNSNIHVAAGSGLNFTGQLTAAAKILRSMVGDSSFSGGNPQIMDASGVYQTLNFDHDYQPGGGSAWASPTDWQNQAQSTFGGTVQDSTMGVTEITPPVPELLTNPANPDVVAHQMIEMPQASDSAGLKAAKLYSQAGLKIEVNPGGTIKASDYNGSDVTAAVTASGALTTTKTFIDARECRTVNVVEVDVAKLTAANLPALTTGKGKGILYVASTDTPKGGMTKYDSKVCAKAGTAANTEPGVRLVNGATLPTTGLTVVSQNPVYVQGDYNVTANYTNPVTGAASHPPAAIMGDAITALSNNWTANSSDTKGNQDVNKRPATVTTQNAAFMTGPSRESVPGPWNGALHNDIRFLEDWKGNVPYNYSGSLVSLWHSMQATADFRGCTGSFASGCYYHAPKRNWGYDPLFDAAPPPGAPGAIVITPGQWAQK